MLFNIFGRTSSRNSSRKSNTSRKNEPSGDGLRRWARRSAFGLAIAAFGVLSVLVGLRAQEFLYRSPFFEIKSVRLYGLDSELDREVSESARLNSIQGWNLIRLNTDSLKRKVERHPRIARAEVAKVFPDTVRIKATERQAVAFLSAGELYRIDAEGVLLEEVTSAGGGGRAESLPFVSGLSLNGLELGGRIEDERLDRAIDLLGSIYAMNGDLFAKVSEINIGEAGELTMYLRKGLEVRLGSADAIKQMPVLEEFLESSPAGDAITVVDLSFEGQVVTN
jgi:cell division protein FtsQ